LTEREAEGSTPRWSGNGSAFVGVIGQRFEKNVLIISVDYLFNWARKSSLWALTLGLACSAIEMIGATTARFDLARFGAEVFRPSPRQAD
jgi:NADH-quinone oxidoreductase subunit B